MLELINNDWSLRINLNGGRIIQLKKATRIILGSFNRTDGKAGNTHLCVPNFGAEGKELGLPFHGLARQETWQAIDTSDDLEGTFDVLAKQVMGTVSISTILPKTLLFPSQLRVHQTFKLDSDFIHVIKITNIGDKPVPVNLGIHYYWAAPKDWQGTQINKKDISELIANNKAMKLSNKFTITFPKQKPLNIEQAGFSNAVLWTGFKEQENTKIYDQKYCCIEPVIGIDDYFGSKKSYLSPGNSIKTEFIIQA